MSARKSSSIWDHFTVDPANRTVVVCKVCDVKLSRGMTVTQNTENTHSHKECMNSWMS